MSPSAPSRFRAADYRQHPAMEFASTHWLRTSIYGRHLLKLKLRQMRPDLGIVLVREQPQYEALLEAIVDVLELRDWAAPCTLSQRLASVRAILRIAWNIDAVSAPRPAPPGEACAERGDSRPALQAHAACLAGPSTHNSGDS